MATTQYIRYPGSAASGVSSLNTLIGALTLAAGSGITITPSGGNTLTIAATGSGAGVSSVTASSPLASSGGTTPNLTIQVATSGQSGYLSSTDWSTFNAKQPAGSYLTALTGDGTASGPGSSVLTLATVNATPNNYGQANQVGAFTVNAKGLITAASNLSIQISTSQVTNLVSDLAAKQATGNYITALTGDVTAAGPGSAAASLVATSNSTLTTLSALSLPGAQVAGNIAGNAANITASSNATLTTLSSLALPTSQLTGLVAVTQGGTGLGTLTANNVILGNGTSTPSFVAPGPSGNVLTSNGSTWTSAPPGTPPFLATRVSYVASGQTITPGGVGQQVAFDTVDYDTLSAWSLGGGAFNVPFTGYYRVAGAIEIGAIATGQAAVFLVEGASILTELGNAPPTSGSQVVSGGDVLHWTVGQSIEVHAFQNSAVPVALAPSGAVSTYMTFQYLGT